MRRIRPEPPDVNSVFTPGSHAKAMLPSSRIPFIARLALGVSFIGCAIVMVGPFQSLEGALVPWDKASHFLAFYGFTALSFLAFPRHRRLDLAVAAIVMGCGIEALQGLAGRDAGLGDVLANAAGAFAVYAPGYLERLRQGARHPGGLRERRGQRRRTARSTPDMPTVSETA